VIAFQTDMTRVITFMLGRAGSNRPYRAIGIADGHHTLSHHMNDPEKIEEVATKSDGLPHARPGRPQKAMVCSTPARQTTKKNDGLPHARPGRPQKAMVCPTPDLADQIDAYLVKTITYYLEKLKSTPDGDGSLRRLRAPDLSFRAQRSSVPS